MKNNQYTFNNSSKLSLLLNYRVAKFFPPCPNIISLMKNTKKDVDTKSVFYCTISKFQFYTRIILDLRSQLRDNIKEQNKLPVLGTLVI